MSLESWKALFEIGGVILLFLTFVFGAGALITSNRINALQEVRLRQFSQTLTDSQTESGKQQVRAADADARVAGLEKDAAEAKTELAKQQEKTASAERSLLELQQQVKHRVISADHGNA